MLPNEVFALECIARYAREGLVVDSSNGQFAHCPYPRPKGQKKRLTGDLGYYLTFEDHQHQGLLQSVDVGRRCYYVPHAKRYLDTYPPNYFELYDIYKKFNAWTEEAKKKISEANSGRTQTEEHKKKISEANSGEKNSNYGNTGALNPCSKAIIVIKPDGTELHFGGISEAARKLEVADSNLCRYVKYGKQPEKGRFKYWQFFYAE